MAPCKSGNDLVMKQQPANYDLNVFVNCPFDAEYSPLLKTLLFVLVSFDLNPRLALERSDSGEVRLEKIKELIEASKYGIHDLSRSRAKKVGEYFRHNMPFELGLDLGCRSYLDEDYYKDKKILILEEERYSVQKSLSDLSFADCKCHKGVAEEMVYAIRSWFAENGFQDLDSPSVIWDNYNFFLASLYEEKAKEGWKKKDINRMPIAEYLSEVFNYLEE